MRHRVYGKHLGRNKNQRSALFKSLVRSLFLYQSIETTEPKAKAIKPLVDRIISNAMSPTARKLVSEFFNQKGIEIKLYDEVLPRIGTRVSGFTSTARLGRRLGDGAMVVKMSLLLEEPKARVKGKGESKDSLQLTANRKQPANNEKKPKKAVSRKLKAVSADVVETSKEAK